jgi:hypothetical protein
MAYLMYQYIRHTKRITCPILSLSNTKALEMAPSPGPFESFTIRAISWHAPQAGSLPEA